MRGLKRRDDAFGLAEQLEALQRLFVGRRDVHRAFALFVERVLRPNARIVEAG